MRAKNKLIHGVGINDADYCVQPKIDGKQQFCKFYQTWVSMIARCYSRVEKVRSPSYAECSVCSEWLTFSNFKSWMEKQDWKGNQLDKDLLVKGNKVYSPETCCFIPGRVNTFLCSGGQPDNGFPMGVHFKKRIGKFIAACKNPLNGRSITIGRFDNQEDAHEAWKRKKHEYACELSKSCIDERASKALMERFK